jgi:hypothetical protein
MSIRLASRASLPERFISSLQNLGGRSSWTRKRHNDSFYTLCRRGWTVDSSSPPRHWRTKKSRPLWIVSIICDRSTWPANMIPLVTVSCAESTFPILITADHKGRWAQSPRWFPSTLESTGPHCPTLAESISHSWSPRFPLIIFFFYLFFFSLFPSADSPRATDRPSCSWRLDSN